MCLVFHFSARSSSKRSPYPTFTVSQGFSEGRIEIKAYSGPRPWSSAPGVCQPGRSQPTIICRYHHCTVCSYAANTDLPLTYSSMSAALTVVRITCNCTTYNHMHTLFDGLRLSANLAVRSSSAHRWKATHLKNWFLGKVRLNLLCTLPSRSPLDWCGRSPQAFRDWARCTP